MDETLRMSDLPLITQEVIAAIGGLSRVEQATVTSDETSEGLLRIVSVSIDGAPADKPNHVPCLYTGALPVGTRVAVLWDPPHQCYILGPVTDAGATPYGRISLKCGSGSTPTVQHVTGLNQIQFCCIEFADGVTPVVGVDAYIPIPFNGAWHLDAMLPYLGGETGDYMVQGYLEVTDHDGALLSPLSQPAWAEGSWPKGTMTLTTPFPLPAGAQVRAFLFTDAPGGVTVESRAFLALSPVSSRMAPVTRCSKHD